MTKKEFQELASLLDTKLNELREAMREERREEMRDLRREMRDLRREEMGDLRREMRARTAYSPYFGRPEPRSRNAGDRISGEGIFGRPQGDYGESL